jgi:hypothetical protein
VLFCGGYQGTPQAVSQAATWLQPGCRDVAMRVAAGR